MGCCESKELWEELTEAIEEEDKVKLQAGLKDMNDVNELMFEDPTFGNCSILHLAAKQGNWDLVIPILKAEGDVDVESTRGLTALTAALVSGQDEVAFNFLTPTPGVKAIADKNRENSKGLTPLLIAILYRRELAVEILMRMEVDLAHVSTKGGTKGLTPLLVAIHKKFNEAVKLIIEGGAPLDAKSNMGQHPIAFAAERDNVEAVMELLNNGAEPRDLKILNNDEDISLWTWAARNAYQDVLDKLADMDIVE